MSFSLYLNGIASQTLISFENCSYANDDTLSVGSVKVYSTAKLQDLKRHLKVLELCEKVTNNHVQENLKKSKNILATTKTPGTKFYKEGLGPPVSSFIDMRMINYYYETTKINKLELKVDGQLCNTAVLKELLKGVKLSKREHQQIFGSGNVSK